MDFFSDPDKLDLTVGRKGFGPVRDNIIQAYQSQAGIGKRTFDRVSRLTPSDLLLGQPNGHRHSAYQPCLDGTVEGSVRKRIESIALVQPDPAFPKRLS